MSVAIKLEDNLYPKSLKNIYDCPQIIYALGNVNLLKEKKILAVVGSRKMSQYGKEIVKKFVPELVKNNWVIVSGMALGIDAEVQKVVLENKGKTIAVLASGVDVVSPRSNKWLYEKILENNGLIISEYKNGTVPNRIKFLERNKIIAGLSLGVMVIEGALKSGTLVTAKLALEQGREVLAVPGRIDEENSKTPNFLIKNGANIITNIEDVWEIFEGV